MATFQEITPETLTENPFHLIGKEWMLVTAGTEQKLNMMTASWGGLGVMWNKNVAFVVIRPTRYTKEFIDANESFSLSFYDESYKKTLTLCGRTSGRDSDKIQASGLTPAFDAAPYFEEAKLVLFCKKLFAMPYAESAFLNEELRKANYPLKDYHTLYIAEIEKVLKKDN